MKKLFMIVFVLTQLSCTDTNDLILEFNDKNVDFSEVVEGDWERVCFLGPYSDNTVAHTLLGFDWDVENQSRISDLDSITLLLFANSYEVFEYSEVSREIDFSIFHNTCINRHNAKFSVGENRVLNLDR